MSANSPRGFSVRALGEIAIRCADLDAMTRFYRDVIGLAPLPGGHRDGIVFFALGESYGGHTAVLALFRDDGAARALTPSEAGPPVAGARSSLHHLALAVDAAEQEAAIGWLRGHGLPVSVQEFGWIGWRGVFTTDPEGNTVELVARVAGPAAQG